MTEAEAHDWIVAHFGESCLPVLEQIAAAVAQETLTQNLIAPSTVDTMWSRHIVDSAQLLALSGATSGRWIDIGSGAGFPGLVVAALSDYETVLVEVRRKRAVFLQTLVVELGLEKRVSVLGSRIEQQSLAADVISARAVASLTDIFGWAANSASLTTRWILPKGKSAREEVARAQQAWHGVFHVEQSVTDPDSMIVIASNVARRGASQ